MVETDTQRQDKKNKGRKNKPCVFLFLLHFRRFVSEDHTRGMFKEPDEYQSRQKNGYDRNGGMRKYPGRKSKQFCQKNSKWRSASDNKNSCKKQDARYWQNAEDAFDIGDFC